MQSDPRPCLRAPPTKHFGGGKWADTRLTYLSTEVSAPSELLDWKRAALGPGVALILILRHGFKKTAVSGAWKIRNVDPYSAADRPIYRPLCATKCLRILPSSTYYGTNYGKMRPFRRVGNLLMLSGHIPDLPNGEPLHPGRVGAEVTVEDA